MLKYNVRISPVGNDLNLTFPLSSKSNLSGLSQDIQDLVTDQSDNSINLGTDGEKTRFTPNGFTGITFWNGIMTGFTTLEVKTQAYVNSFFIIQIYDTPVSDTQTLLHTSFINGYYFTTGVTAIFDWTNVFEYTDLHIPTDYLATFSGNTVNVYCKTNFYNAKLGKIDPFYDVYATGNTESKLYKMMTLNKTNRTYSITGNMHFAKINNPEYVELINDSIESFNVEKPTYPTGNTFNPNGTYTII